MNVYQAIRRYAERKPPHLPKVAIKTGMYAIAFKHTVAQEEKEKVEKYIDMMLDEFFVSERDVGKPG